MESSIILDKISWSALVHTRTYNVDYHYITKPSDFGDQEIAWVNSHIDDLLSAIGNNPPSDLLSRFMLSNDKHWVFGILCSVSRLMSDADRHCLASEFLNKEATEHEQNMSFDKASRRIAYLRLAYVIPKTSELQQIPPINFDISIFKPLYKYVAKRWLANYQKPVEILPYFFDKEFVEDLFVQSLSTSNLPILNTNPYVLNLYPNNDSYTTSLWYSFSFCKEPTSLLISQVVSQKLKDSKFMNAATQDVGQDTSYNRSLPKNSTELPTVDLAKNIVDVIGESVSKLFESISNQQSPQNLLDVKEDIKELLQRFGEMEQRVKKLEDSIKTDGN